MIEKLYNTINGDIRKGDINIFLEMAIDNFIVFDKNVKHIKGLLEDRMTIKNPIDGSPLELRGFKHLDELFEISQQSTKYWIQGILLLSTFYEALINEIGIIGLSKSYLDKHLDKLSIISKWEIILKIVYDKTISQESHHFENIKKIVDQRNILAHYKSKKANPEDKKDMQDYGSLLKKGLYSTKYIIEKLKEIDSEKQIISFCEIEKQLKRLE